jgi:hypothetical protein
MAQLVTEEVDYGRENRVSAHPPTIIIQSGGHGKTRRIEVEDEDKDEVKDEGTVVIVIVAICRWRIDDGKTTRRNNVGRVRREEEAKTK